MYDASLDSIVARGEFVYAVFVPSPAFVLETLFDLAEAGGLEGEEAFALIHCCQFRSNLLPEFRRLGEIERFPTRRIAVAWCRGCGLRFADTALNAAAAAMMLRSVVLIQQTCRPPPERTGAHRGH